MVRMCVRACVRVRRDRIAECSLYHEIMSLYILSCRTVHHMITVQRCIITAGIRIKFSEIVWHREPLLTGQNSRSIRRFPRIWRSLCLWLWLFESVRPALQSTGGSKTDSTDANLLCRATCACSERFLASLSSVRDSVCVTAVSALCSFKAASSALRAAFSLFAAADSVIIERLGVKKWSRR